MFVCFLPKTSTTQKARENTGQEKGHSLAITLRNDGERIAFASTYKTHGERAPKTHPRAWHPQNKPNAPEENVTPAYGSQRHVAKRTSSYLGDITGWVDVKPNMPKHVEPSACLTPEPRSPAYDDRQSSRVFRAFSRTYTHTHKHTQGLCIVSSFTIITRDGKQRIAHRLVVVSRIISTMYIVCSTHRKPLLHAFYRCEAQTCSLARVNNSMV